MKKVIRSSSDKGFVLRAKTWSDMIRQLEEKGYFVDSAYKRNPEKEISAFKGGRDTKSSEPVIISVNQYFNGDYEVMEKYIHHDAYYDSIDECDKITAAYADDDLLDEDDLDWERLATKTVLDSDGFTTDYTLYKNKSEDVYICMFGDSDVYRPSLDYSDWDGSTEEEAWEWFNSYNGFEDDLDEEY